MATKRIAAGVCLLLLASSPGCDGDRRRNALPSASTSSAPAAVSSGAAPTTAPVASPSPAVAVDARGRLSVGFPADVPAEVAGALGRVYVDGDWVALSDYPQRALERRAGPGGDEVVVRAVGLPGRPDLTLTLRPRPGGVLLCSLAATNRTPATVHVEGFELSVRPGEGGWVRLGDRPTDSVLWAQGQASWNFAGTIKVTPGQVEHDAHGGRVPDEELFRLGNNVFDVVSTLALLAAGRDRIPLSWWNVVVEEPAKRRALLAGALTAERFKTSVLVGHDPATAAGLPAAGRQGFTTFRIVSGLTGDRVPLAPGAALASEELVLAVHDSGLQALDGYARQTADRMTRLPTSPNSGKARIGWSSWSHFYTQVDERGVLEQARYMAQALLPLGFDVVQLDDGWQRAWGDWHANSKFPSGVAGLTRTIKGLGLKPGLWLAPFLVDENLPLVAQHPDWILRDPRGNRIAFTLRPGDRKLVLDVSHPAAAAWAKANLVRLRAAGVEVFKVDFLFAAGFEGQHHDPHATGLSTYRQAVRLIRDAVGPDATLIGIAGPWLASAGAFDFYRQSYDVETNILGPSYFFFEAAARGSIARAHVHNRWFGADADHVIVEYPLPLEAARANATYVALCGGVYLLGDDMLRVGRDRRAIATDPFLLALVKEDRTAVPLDLFRRPNDRFGVDPFVTAITGSVGSQAYAVPEVPTLWKLTRPSGKTVLAVFNWSDQSRRRSLSFAELKLAPGTYDARDVWAGGTQTLSDPIDLTQPARSVTLWEVSRR